MNQGKVSSMTVLPASTPTPAETWFCASGPSPEQSVIMPSGTAPRIGSTMLPTRPARDGTRRRNSLPLLMRFEAWYRMTE